MKLNCTYNPSGLPILSKAQINEVAEEILRLYFPELLRDAKPLDLLRLMQEFLYILGEIGSDHAFFERVYPKHKKICLNGTTLAYEIGRHGDAFLMTEGMMQEDFRLLISLIGLMNSFYTSLCGIISWWDQVQQPGRFERTGPGLV